MNAGSRKLPRLRTKLSTDQDETATVTCGPSVLVELWLVQLPFHYKATYLRAFFGEDLGRAG